MFCTLVELKEMISQLTIARLKSFQRQLGPLVLGIFVVPEHLARKVQGTIKYKLIIKKERTGRMVEQTCVQLKESNKRLHRNQHNGVHDRRVQ